LLCGLSVSLLLSRLLLFFIAAAKGAPDAAHRGTCRGTFTGITCYSSADGS
jgi:hypothetical protein